MKFIPRKCTHSEAIVRRRSADKVFLDILQNAQGNTCQCLFFNEVAGLRPAILLKVTSAAK